MMAQTLPNGVVIPQQKEPISRAGVQEIRTLGASVDTLLGGKSDLGHRHRWSEITDSTNVLAYRGEITAQDSIDTLIGNAAQGTYRLVQSAAEAHGLGPSGGTLIVLQAGGTTGVSSPNTVHLWEPIDGQPLRRGHDAYGNWTPWGHDRWFQGPVTAGTDLNSILTPSLRTVDGRLAITNMPPALTGAPFTLETVRIGGSWTKQIATDGNNRRRYRIHTGTAWAANGAWNAEAGGGSLGLASVEATGEWTSLDEEISLLRTLGQHREAEYFEVGRSVQGRVIPGIRVGFATEEDGSPRPTVLVTAGVHANERGTREGALRLVRELIQTETLDRYRLGIIVIPNVNPDGFAAWTRNNANNVNLNRDFIDATQPETQAVRALVERENIIGAVDLHGGGQGLRVNFVGPDDTRHTIKPAVMERSQRMFDAVWEWVLDNDEEPWLYPFTDGSDGAGLVGTFHNGIAADYDVPSLLLELPFISMIDRDDRFLPPRVWMAYAAAMFVHGAIDVIYRERLAFQAVTRGQSYTIPERHRGQLEQARAASFDSGDLDITSSLTGIESGSAILTRIGQQVWLDFQDVKITAPGNFVQWDGAIPDGLRPPRMIDLPMQGRGSGDTAGPVRVSSGGQLIVYRPAGTVRGIVTWFTRQAPPA